MPNENFFKTTNSYHEFIILDRIHKYSKITQRELSRILNISLALINTKLSFYESKGDLKRVHHNSKNVEYQITIKGLKRFRQLNMMYFHDSQVLYEEAKKNVFDFIKGLIAKGFNNIILYGAGEVSIILLNVISTSFDKELNIISIIDDDPYKIGNMLSGISITNINESIKFEYDGILIASHNYQDIMLAKLKQFGFDEKKVITFF
jgi:NADH/NAD ratio-sensing transcriptional regulator Rex